MEWGSVISSLLALIFGLLGLQWKEQRSFNAKISDEVKSKLDKEDCKESRDGCSRGPSWDDFNRHSHTGLPPDARITR